MNKSVKFSPEVRERAVRMAQEPRLERIVGRLPITAWCRWAAQQVTQYLLLGLSAGLLPMQPGL
jgi:hypothetical protein